LTLRLLHVVHPNTERMGFWERMTSVDIAGVVHRAGVAATSDGVWPWGETEIEDMDMGEENEWDPVVEMADWAVSCGCIIMDSDICKGVRTGAVCIPGAGADAAGVEVACDGGPAMTVPQQDSLVAGASPRL
jgi:hypothetical protein